MLSHSTPTIIMEAMNIKVETTIFAAEEHAVLNAKEIGEVDMVVRETLI